MSGTFATSLVGLALASAFLVPVRASQDDAQDAYSRAYTLEHEARAYEDALRIYERIAADGAADAQLRERARRRARAVAEEIASADFAEIMPGNAFLYLEVNRPGAQLSALLDQLGLLGGWDRLLEEGARSFAISPELIDGLVGFRGAALAVTGVPLGNGPPSGVLVVHPGDHGIARGMLETALPAAGLAVEPIEGQPTWRVEEQAFVTLSARMLVASTSREEIAGVLRRLRGDREDSLANSPAMRANLALRRDDCVYICLNAEPIRPLVTGLLGMASAGNPQLAAAAALLDVQSFESVVVRAGVDADGISVDTVLRLQDGHRNLAFNLLRPAPIDREILRTIPAGAAGFVTASLNERGPAIAPLHTNANDEPVITGMDLGREVFANLVGVSLFALPPDGDAAGTLPDVAVVISANDPQRSRAIWNLALGLASLASGGVSLEPGQVEIAEHPAEKYVAAGGIPIYLVQHESELLISPSENAIARALKARDDGNSVLQDPAFAEELARLGEGTTGLAMLHLGRLTRVGTPYLPAEERAELAPFAGIVSNTTVAISNRHSANEMGFHLALRGLPKVDGLVAQLLQQRQSSASVPQPSAAAMERVTGADDLRARFDVLAERGAIDEARAVAKPFVNGMKGDARALNNFAWALLTEERYQQRFDELALSVSQLSNEASGYGTWQYVDTLALASFRHGEIDKAIELQKKALELVGDGAGRADMEASLKRYASARGGVVIR